MRLSLGSLFVGLALFIGVVPVAADDLGQCAMCRWTGVADEADIFGDAPSAGCGTLVSTTSCRQSWSYSEPTCPSGIGYGYYIYTQKKFWTGSTYVYQLWLSPGTSVNTRCTRYSTTCIPTNCWG